MPNNIRKGDVVIGIKSSGFHSNGYTLIRKNIGWRESGNEEFLNKLLEPTKIYALDIKKIKIIPNNTSNDPTTSNNIKIKGLAHITGNGFDNIERILPKNMIVKYDDKFLYEDDFPAHADTVSYTHLTLPTTPYV